MPERDPHDPVYGEKEISRILKRAAALQQETSYVGEGLSLEEVQQVAAEVGINPRYVAMAASEIGGSETEKEPFQLFGGSLSILEERVLPGRLSEMQREEMLAEIRRTYHQAGIVTRVGRTTDWTHSTQGDQIQVSITERGERTTVRVLERSLRVAVLTYVLPLGFVLPFAVNVPLILGFNAFPAVLFVLLALVASFFGSRLVYSSINTRKQRKARRLLKRLAHIAAEPDEELDVAPAPALPEAGRLDASLLDAPSDDAGVTAPERSRTRS